jgi:cytochrome c biogenesis protein CcdA
LGILLRYRGFRALWLGQLLSQFGNAVFLVMGLWEIQLRSPFLLSIAGLAMVLPSLLAAAGGVLVDRYEPGRLMLYTDILRGVAVVAGLAALLLPGALVGICTVPCSGAIYLDVIAVLHASGGGIVGLALLALYNIAFILPLLLFLLLVSNRRVLGALGRWNRQNGAAVKTVLALGVVLMSFGLLYSLGM